MAGTEPEDAKGQPKVRWKRDKLATTFANVVNLQTTREQVDLYFGTNETWSADVAAGEGAVEVELTNRIILSPHAAKRLHRALGDVLKQYEARHGTLEV